jgi:ribosome biogenesis protein MAK21
VKAAKADKRKVNHHVSDAKSDGTVEDGSDEDSDPEEAAIWKVRLTGNVKPVLLIAPIQAMKASLPKAEDDEDGEDVDDDVDDDDDDDDDDVDHVFQDSESDGHASFDTNTEEDEGTSSDAKDDINVNWEFDGVEFSGVDGSVNSYPLPTRPKLTLYDQDESDTQALPTLSNGKKRKRKGRGNEDERTRKKKLRALPTFASYEDYARMIEDGPEENI